MKKGRKGSFGFKIVLFLYLFSFFLLSSILLLLLLRRRFNILNTSHLPLPLSTLSTPNLPTSPSTLQGPSRFYFKTSLSPPNEQPPLPPLNNQPTFQLQNKNPSPFQPNHHARPKTPLHAQGLQRIRPTHSRRLRLLLGTLLR